MTFPRFDFPDGEKLETLRRLDRFREWQSLDERRYCLVCGNLITGREIEVLAENPGRGSVQVACPTRNCNSIPMDWVLPTGEIMANLALRKGIRLPQSSE